MIMSTILRSVAIVFLVVCLAWLSQGCAARVDQGSDNHPVTCEPGASPEAGGDVSLCAGMDPKSVLIVTLCDGPRRKEPFHTTGCTQRPALEGNVWCCVADTVEVKP